MKVENNQQSQPDMSQKMDEMLQQPVQPVAPQPMRPMNGAAKVKKKKNVPAIVLGVVAVLGIGTAAYFGVQYFGEKDRADNLAKSNASVQAESAETTGEETSEVAATTASRGFDSSKVKNKSSNDEYFVLRGSEYGVGGSLSEDNKSLELGFDYNVLSLSGYTRAQVPEDTRKISFDQEVTNLEFGGMGQDVAGSVILYAMQDGSLKYTSVNKMLEQGSFAVHGTVKGVSNVVAFYNVYSGYKDGVGGGSDIVVQDAKGDLYSVYNLLGNDFDNGL